MKPNRCIFDILTAASAILCVCTGYAVAAAMSKYGEIQTVKNYSSNPFWNADSPYNSRMPTPIYATGADLNTAECNNMVANLITSYCALNNECRNVRLADVRPKIMVQLSQLPGHNYATSCGGYIDSVFNNYQKKHGNTSANIITKPATQSAKSTLDIRVQNPYAIKPTEYQQGVAERAAELRELQSVNATPTNLSPADFPKTAADLSISDTMALRSAGYEPYKDKSAYKTIELESEDAFLKRLHDLNPDEYCRRMPTKEECQPGIKYNTFCGTPDKGDPQKYVVGRGATIAWQPGRDNCSFVGWCRDATLTDCAYPQTIGKNEEGTKVFYAKWDCIGAVNQPANCNSGSMCLDPGHMDDKCQCTVIPDTEIDITTGMCKCTNGKDINHECECTDIVNMDDTCQCRPLGEASPGPDGICVCNNGNDISTGCKCKGRAKTWDPTQNECVCPHNSTPDPATGDCVCADPNLSPENECSEKEETFVIADCRTKEEYVKKFLVPGRDKQNEIYFVGSESLHFDTGKSGDNICMRNWQKDDGRKWVFIDPFSWFRTPAYMCINLCDGSYKNTSAGKSITDLFADATGLTLCRQDGDAYQLSNSSDYLDSENKKFKTTENKLRDFFGSLPSYYSSLRWHTCETQWHWMLLIDKIDSDGKQKAWATVHISGDGNIGQVYWHDK